MDHCILTPVRISVKPHQYKIFWSSIVILNGIYVTLRTNENILPHSIFQILHFHVLYLHTAALVISHPIYSETHELNLQKKCLLGTSFLLGYDVASLGYLWRWNHYVMLAWFIYCSDLSDFLYATLRMQINTNTNVVNQFASHAESYPRRTVTSLTTKNLKF